VARGGERREKQQVRFLWKLLVSASHRREVRRFVAFLENP